jgi:hypothetical protein
MIDGLGLRSLGLQQLMFAGLNRKATVHHESQFKKQGTGWFLTSPSRE